MLQPSVLLAGPTPCTWLRLDHCHNYILW